LKIGCKGRGIQRNEKAKGVEKFKAGSPQHNVLTMKDIAIQMLHQ
jgi:hypothetical protein